MKKSISKTHTKSTKRIDEIIKKEEFYRRGEEEIRSVLKEAQRIKVETGKRIVERLWKEQGEKCIGLLTDIDIDFGFNPFSENDKIEERRIFVENMKSIFNPLIETKVLGIPIFKIVVEFFEKGGEYALKEVKEEAQEGEIDVDWEYEYEEAKKEMKKDESMSRIRKIPKEELMRIFRKKKAKVKKMKEATAEEAVNKYCEDEGGKRKCLIILKEIREGRKKIEERDKYCSEEIWGDDHKERNNDPLLIAIKKAIEANDCPCVMTLSRGCYLPSCCSIYTKHNKREYSLFEYSYEVCSDECTLFLLEAGGGIEQKFNLQRTPLMETLRTGNDLIGIFLIEEGANIEAKDGDGKTPLHWAAYKNRVEIAKLLIERGANIDVIGNDGKTPLNWATFSFWNCIEAAKLLIERGANIEVKDKYGKTPLHWAVDKNRVEITKLLIERGANIDVIDNDGKTPLHIAAYRNREEIVKLLIERGANIKTKDKDGKTPLQRAYGKVVKAIFEAAAKGTEKE